MMNSEYDHFFLTIWKNIVVFDASLGGKSFFWQTLGAGSYPCDDGFGHRNCIGGLIFPTIVLN